jgi:aryl-alcohol dehydrogenase-like predicted oxidoreductase
MDKIDPHSGAASLPTRRLGVNGPVVTALGLGCMRLEDSAAHRAESIATIQEALDCGISFLNTGDFYGMGQSEMLIREVIRGRRDKVFISVKYGGQRDPSGNVLGFDASYNATLTSLAYSLRRLGTDHIDLYQPARIFSHTPLEETMGALAEAVRRGYIRYIGLSEVGPKTIRRAAAIHPILMVEAEYSIIAREIEANVIPAARAAGAGVVAYAVLAAGLLSGHAQAAAVGTGTNLEGVQGTGPRFEEENFQKNMVLVERLKKIAAELQITSTQLAIAWVLAQGNDILPLVGATSPAILREAIGALEIKLDAAVLAEIAAACPVDAVAGDYFSGPGREQIVAERRQ